MRAYRLNSPGLDSLSMFELDVPKPGTGQLLVRLRAASLNYRDLMVVQDRYKLSDLKFPLIPLSDAAGEVVAVGEGVTEFGVGDRVIGNFFQKWGDGPFDKEKGDSALGGAIDGVLREQIVFNQIATVKIPPHLSYEEASALPCAGLTAWVALAALGKLKAGETVLALGTGGVSIFALQIAKSFGAKVILTSSSDEKLARGRALGADETINYVQVPDWGARVRQLTSNGGVDHVLEVGGEGTLPQSLQAVREGGHLTLVGLLSGNFPDAKVAANNDRGVRVDSVYVGSTRDLQEFCEFLNTNSLRPVVDRVFPFEQAREALEFLQAGAHFGKVVIRI